MGKSDGGERPLISVAERHTITDLSLLSTHDIEVSRAEYGMLTQAMLMRGNMRIVLDAVVEGTPLSGDALSEAVAALQRRHVWLRCVLAERGDGKKRTLVMREDTSVAVPVRDITGGADDMSADEVAWGQVASDPLRLGEPLWRVLVERVGESTTRVYLLLEHGIGDGVSSTALLGELLGLACSDRAAVDCSASELIPIAPIEAINADNKTGCFSGCARTCETMGIVRKFVFGAKGFVWPETTPTGGAVAESVVHAHTFTLTADETSTLLAHSRANSTTVTGAVCACLVLAAADTLQAAGETFKAVSCAAAIDMRRRYANTRVPRHELACHISGWPLPPISVPRGDAAAMNTPAAMWDVARTLRANLLVPVENRKFLSVGRMFEDVYSGLADAFKAGPEKWKDDVHATTSSTSWGVCDVARTYGAHTVDHVRARVMLHGTRLCVLIFHTCADRLSLTLQHPSPACPPERGATMAQHLERRLRVLLAEAEE